MLKRAAPMQVWLCKHAVASRYPALLLAAALGVAGCGGPSFDGHVYKSDDVSFRVGPLPPSWRGIDVEGARLAFRDDAAGATIAVNGRCGVDGDDVPLRALTHHLFLNFTQIQVQSSQPSQLDGREALRTELVAELDGVPRRFVIFVLKKNSCVYDFMWIGNPQANADASGAFQRFVRGFSTETSGSDA